MEFNSQVIGNNLFIAHFKGYYICHMWNSLFFRKMEGDHSRIFVIIKLNVRDFQSISRESKSYLNNLCYCIIQNTQKTTRYYIWIVYIFCRNVKSIFVVIVYQKFLQWSLMARLTSSGYKQKMWKKNISKESLIKALAKQMNLIW